LVGIVELGDGCGVVVGVDDIEIGRFAVVVGLGGPTVVAAGMRWGVLVEVIEPLLGGRPARRRGSRGVAGAHRDLTGGAGAPARPPGGGR